MRSPAALKVLIVDDDTDILQLLKYNLEKDGFKVKILENSRQALSVARDFRPDLIILDILMAPENGISLCRMLRTDQQFRETYIFFLSALGDTSIQREALDAGGDEFIEKVMGLRALTYKVRAVLRGKFVIHKSVQEIRLGDLTISRVASTARIGDEVFQLSKPEFELLFFLAQNQGKVFSLENLIQNIWGSELFLLASSVDVYVQNLHRKVGRALTLQTGNNQYTLRVRR